MFRKGLQKRSARSIYSKPLQRRYDAALAEPVVSGEEDSLVETHGGVHDVVQNRGDQRLVGELQSGQRAAQRGERVGRRGELHFLDGVAHVGLVEHRSGVQLAQNHWLGGQRTRRDAAAEHERRQEVGIVSESDPAVQKERTAMQILRKAARERGRIGLKSGFEGQTDGNRRRGGKLLNRHRYVLF